MDKLALNDIEMDPIQPKPLKSSTSSSTAVSKVSPNMDQEEEKKKIGLSGVVAILALVLALLALILGIFLTANILNQPSTSQDQSEQDLQVSTIVDQESQREDIKSLQAQIDKLVSTQSEANSSIMSLQARIFDLLVDFQNQVNMSSADILMKATQQQDKVAQELQALELYRNRTTQEISNLQAGIYDAVKAFENEIEKLTNYISTSVDVDLITLKENTLVHTNQLTKLISGLRSINATLQGLDTFIIDNNTMIGTFERPATSCRDIPRNSPSGNYWMKTRRTQLPFEVFCDANQRDCGCNFANLWMRVANLDMTNPSQQCPLRFELINRSQAPRRTCGRVTSGCVSVTYPVHGIEYSRVCGRIVGYQVGSPSGFQTGTNSINSHYMAGISITHGSPRQHIWSLVNARGEGYTSEVCPCILGANSLSAATSFVGNDYFCDSAVSGSNAVDGRFYPSDPLWDGQGCGSRSTCCQFNNPPWFCKQLPRPTTDDIELRLCENSGPSADDTPIEIIELYVI